MNHILAATVVVSAAISTRDLVIGVIVIVGGIFLYLWKKLDMKPLVAAILLGVVVLCGMTLGALATVAKFLSSVSGGRLP